MKKLSTLIIILLFPLVGISTEYDMKCVPVARNMHRCENKEIVCYKTTYSEYFQCKFKKPIKKQTIVNVTP